MPRYIGARAGRVNLRKLCRLDEIDPGSGREISLDTGGGRLDLALFRVGGGVRAYRNACPHQGRPLSWAPGKFLLEDGGRLVCPHHGASFDVASGHCLSGPCRGASLSPVEVIVDAQVVSLPSPENHPG